MAPWAAAACGGDDNDTNTPGAGGSGSGGEAGESSGGSSGGKAGSTGSGGSGQAGDTGEAGSGGDGGEPPSTTGGTQLGFVAAGERSTSANFVLFGSLGEGPGGSTLMTSESYRLEGGLIAPE